MAIIIGSARVSEKGTYTTGVAGDQKQTSSTNDTVGEVSMQNFYVHSKGWYILRPKDATIANKLAEGMKIACNNKHIGYNQNQRLQVVTAGINTTTDVNADCSALVRTCIKYASGKDLGNFTTANEATVLANSGLFAAKVKYTTSTPLYNGDVLVTCTKGHTVIVVSGANARVTASAASVQYYPKYTGTSTSIAAALKSLGIDNSYTHRCAIAKANSITGYSGTAAQNTNMLTLLKAGKLIKA